MSIKDYSFFITGATGFIGSYLIKKLLKEGAVVHVLVRNKNTQERLKEVKDKIRIHFGDITDFPKIKQILSKIDVDYILNLAKQKDEKNNLRIFINTNILGLANLLEASSSLNIKHFIQFGSSTEYGKHNSAINENYQPNPISYQGVSKAAASLLCRQAFLGQNKPVTILRIFNVYGPDDNEYRFLPTIIRSILTNQEFAITRAGFSRDWIYIDDLIDLLFKTINKPEVFGEIINAGSGIQYKNEEILKYVENIINKKAKYTIGTYQESKCDTNTWLADISKAKRLLDWAPKTDIHSGIKKTINWYINEYC